MTSSLFYLPNQAVTNRLTLPVAAARLFFYLSGTTTKATIYSDSALSLVLANPVICDAFGRAPPVYIDSSLRYRLHVQTANGSVVGDDIDPYIPGTIAGILAVGSAAGGLFYANDATGQLILATGTGADAGLRTDLAAVTGASLVKVAKGQSLQQTLDQVAGANPVIPQVLTSTSTVAIAASQQASGGGSAVTSTASPLASLTGTGARLRDINLIGGTVTAGTSVVGVGVSNVTGSTLSNVSVDLSTSLGADLPGFNLTGNIIHHMSLGLRTTTPGYGYITNEGAGSTNTMSGHVLMGFDLASSTADALAYNNPGAPLSNCVTWGGLLDAGPAGTNTNSGFAMSIAHVQGFVAGGFVGVRSRTAGIHIEDGSAFGVLSSLALMGCQKDGIQYLAEGAGGNLAQSTPIVTCGFALQGTGTAGSAGLRFVYDSSSNASRWPVVGGYVSDFPVGLILDGPGIMPTDMVTVDFCPIIIQGYNPRHYGTIFGNGTALTTIFETTAPSGGRMGKFVGEVSPQTAIIGNSNGSRTAPLSTSDGFAFPSLANLAGAISLPVGASQVALFQAAVRLKGRLRLTVNYTGGAGFFWEGEVASYDGVTMTNTGKPIVHDLTSVAVSSSQIASFTAAQTLGRSDITVSAVTGTIAPGQVITNYGIVGVKVIEQLSGTVGGAGVYLVNAPSPYTAGSATMTTASPFSISGGNVMLTMFNGTSGAVSIASIQVEFDGTYYA